MADTRRVEATQLGYASPEPGKPIQLIPKGAEIVVPVSAKAKWWKELESPAKKGKAAKAEADDKPAE